MSYSAAEKIPQRLGTIPWKYVRKYVATKLVELDCPEIAIDFQAKLARIRRALGDAPDILAKRADVVVDVEAEDEDWREAVEEFADAAVNEWLRADVVEGRRQTPTPCS